MTHRWLLVFHQVSAVGTIEYEPAHSPLFILTVTQETSSYLLIKARDDGGGYGKDRPPKLEMSVFRMPLFEWDECVFYI